MENVMFMGCITVLMTKKYRQTEMAMSIRIMPQLVYSVKHFRVYIKYQKWSFNKNYDMKAKMESLLSIA